MTYFLGIDAGGTSTRAALADDTHVLARAKSGSIKLMRVSAGQAEANLRSLLAELTSASGVAITDVASACVGLGSSIFHPEATRMARNLSGGRHGLAQGIFQVGGQTGGALGPLLAAFIIVEVAAAFKGDGFFTFSARLRMWTLTAFAAGAFA